MAQDVEDVRNNVDGTLSDVRSEAETAFDGARDSFLAVFDEKLAEALAQVNDDMDEVLSNIENAVDASDLDPDAYVTDEAGVPTEGDTTYTVEEVRDLVMAAYEAGHAVAVDQLSDALREARNGLPV